MKRVLLGLTIICNVLIAQQQASHPEPPLAQEKSSKTQAPPNDILDPTSSQDYKTLVFYLDMNSQKLVPVVRELLPTGSDPNRVKQVIEWLSMAPEEEGLQQLWPEIIMLRDVFVVDNKTVVVDFVGDGLSEYQAGVAMEGLLIHSLVDSILESFPWYREVWILIDGQIQETLLGHINIEKALQINHSLVKVDEAIPEEKKPQ